VIAAFRILLLILLPILAAISNVAHAQAAQPAPVVAHHASHEQAPTHHDQQAPCCDMQSCIGCAVPVVALAVPDRSQVLAFVERPVFAAAMPLNHLTVPDPPPPRPQS
jgi:hypothetical protein